MGKVVLIISIFLFVTVITVGVILFIKAIKQSEESRRKWKFDSAIKRKVEKLKRLEEEEKRFKRRNYGGKS